ncbi:MAG: AI-2E family transporter [Prevotella sp.]|nr:AI-2E family transporter [Prevotella sp.]
MLDYEKTITFDRFVRLLGYGLLIVAIFLLVNYLSSVLLPFAAGWLLAYLLFPTVKFVQYRLHVPGRVLSIIVTLVGFIAVVSLLLWLIIPPMIEQFGRLGQLATNYIQHAARIDSIPEAIRQWTETNRDGIMSFLHSSDFANGLKEALPNMFRMLGRTANIIMSIAGSFIALLYMFFILMDWEYLSKAWIKIFPKKSRPFWSELATDAERELSNYIRGQGMVAFIMGVLFCIGFTIIDFPMAIGLGILIGIMDLVPYLHTLALVPTVLLSLLKAADTGQNFWIVLASAVAVFIVVQVIIDMVVTPKVMGKAMGLNPAILLLSLSVWGALLGFIGLIIALPLTTLLIAYYQRYITRDTAVQEQTDLDGPAQ